MYIAIILIIGLTLAAAIVFLFCKVRGLSNRLAATNVLVNRLEIPGIEPRANLRVKASQDEANVVTANDEKRQAPTITWSTITSLSLMLGFIALFQYSKGYGVDFWFFTQSPFAAVATVFTTFMFFTLILLVFYSAALIRLAINDNIGKLTRVDGIGRVKCFIDFSPYIFMALLALALSLSFFLLDDETHFFFTPAGLIIATPFLIAIFFTVWVFLLLSKGTRLVCIKENTYLVFLLNLLHFVTLGFLISPVFKLINEYKWARDIGGEAPMETFIVMISLGVLMALLNK
ncbi:hypothetical protein [Aliidiomarina maris]|uniref:Uncharacterized protein n=1 Tax=Aliidiomarina maris TaxID=531312 RepID=A0A327WQ58_9GAMM|nr:hypothetical protein [Aliidiomarina maris]RAJ92972.1 hypothetical protein B0I24_12116 [Aliidiomarina maris]RUO18462.1 hypothetical protein CWE07_14000 [Aliidiomarina maris]